jgi:hypothetical protein
VCWCGAIDVAERTDARHCFGRLELRLKLFVLLGYLVF